MPEIVYSDNFKNWKRGVMNAQAASGPTLA
ncbi:hypothetical protein Bandiella_01085 [Candidatus Bandiella woodruffii]|uniref:Uncharacterized protein n=1 Tax=Candidatus Bandiella euplotis TaxID=1664265 RepID=A0ABZ0UMK5_9RICK|nr:hypothetical protein Bandiella_01085 [Candidatus Bandiella woodruffii]